jgi:hypothetical protein
MMPQPIETMPDLGNTKAHTGPQPSNRVYLAALALGPDEWDQIAVPDLKSAMVGAACVRSANHRGSLLDTRSTMRKQPDGTYLVYVIRESENGTG